ncbi:MAG TPA: 2-succinyl-6-hydroxy-2,4-cyclohexadiene-1-carboxylate synthase [Ignavibacteriales bacterium]|nr:2-succinyl-6-hydroxy-2,4-cyclohexadiene-1-carboxylate synthase [Ignavibacteriales bacterium]HOL80452.1 2-succinyl-6-hydroxy-2,4-cyclohexadiene-1-carboxylate synthase [Ignavibacteriales bacterium]HPP32641.1 2-succinyl-6-hydroxy-2,4-cyclohexadiene-1-carboxylate synthase [Ignavibacteriales bacterium]
MLIKYNDDFSINVNYPYLNKPKHVIIFVHGFTCSSDDWEKLIKFLQDDILCITYDLPGHGKTTTHDNLDYYSQDFQLKIIDFVKEFFQLNNFGLYGYSMGGRIALNYALTRKIDFLILESTSPGIENADERKQRYEEDKKLADFISRQPLKLFVDEWINKDIFKYKQLLNSNEIEELKQKKLRNAKTGLINSLLALSQGFIEPVWNKLENLDFPVLLLSGSEDEKYSKIHKRMSNSLPNVQNVSIKGVSHNIHSIKAESLSQFVKAFIANL